ncbi:endo alpha-1,4 polygalactosaminidase [Kibdelosporangium persicum]|uniref:Cysteinyl-tRNA synthetase n=1 Tax=Kibdelosporangium persicum TaxID=2698649 RepID=A0ABX2FEI2_9PSEU|nr:endo alpha-1,4 polygalactosaminidase [Kibdelosporangium persicum]NRN69633.1 Cysteinyl-tRNA synthetase [Kibdelosporangium persicum]
MMRFRLLARITSLALVSLAFATSACGQAAEEPKNTQPSVAYQLSSYEDDRLDDLAGKPQQLVIIDLARDAAASYFTAEEIGKLRAKGKTVLAYFEIGSLEDFRPDFERFRTANPDLMLNEWQHWEGEFFVKYWDERWWTSAVKPRVDRALAAGFDGVYMDTPLAYEEIDLALVPGETRQTLGRKMVDQIVRISRYAKQIRPGFLIYPQNSPELRHHTGYTEAIDGIGMEELFFLATDEPCDKDFCAENLREAKALRDAGKRVVAIDYATDPGNIASACRQHRDEGFAGAVTVKPLDTVPPPCP